MGLELSEVVRVAELWRKVYTFKPAAKSCMLFPKIIHMAANKGEINWGGN